MKRTLKIILLIIGILLLAVALLGYIYLAPSWVEEPGLSNELQTKTIISNGKERTFSWYAPRESTNVNTVLYVFHGSGSNDLEVRQSTAYEFDKIADEEGILVVYPAGYKNHWNDCRASADYAANMENIDDFAFFQSLEADLEKELNIQLEYRFATGHSNGGHLCFKLAMEHPEWIDGIAPISANLPIDDNLDCKKSGKFVPVCLINGTADQINPYEGGLVEIMGNVSRGTVLSTDATMEYWTSLGGCTVSKTQTLEDKAVSDKSTVIQTSWTCDSSIQAINYQVVNGGHVIPHPENQMPKLLGTTNRDLNAPRAIWAFFKRLRMGADQMDL